MIKINNILLLFFLLINQFNSLFSNNNSTLENFLSVVGFCIISSASLIVAQQIAMKLAKKTSSSLLRTIENEEKIEEMSKKIAVMVQQYKNLKKNINTLEQAIKDNNQNFPLEELQEALERDKKSYYKLENDIELLEKDLSGLQESQNPTTEVDKIYLNALQQIAPLIIADTKNH